MTCSSILFAATNRRAGGRIRNEALRANGAHREWRDPREGKTQKGVRQASKQKSTCALGDPPLLLECRVSSDPVKP
ncbi:hypothetical protein NDU88_004068 [Pleurodeles waltl]|uniref:Uncharacterized protein n=1 Tax=Pleurodeles waltl TaxID=8319 RepID=A0AAV7V0C8_PLEWA|nr:hypothetical protein NDU88_004068 [Pleurodeles waltl]